MPSRPAIGIRWASWWRRSSTRAAAIDWGPLDATAIRWATNLYNGLNGAVQNLDWGLLGSTIGNGLNTVLHFIDTFSRALTG